MGNDIEKLIEANPETGLGEKIKRDKKGKIIIDVELWTTLSGVTKAQIRKVQVPESAAEPDKIKKRRDQRKKGQWNAKRVKRNSLTRRHWHITNGQLMEKRLASDSWFWKYRAAKNLNVSCAKECSNKSGQRRIMYNSHAPEGKQNTKSPN